ncbi:MAG: amino acid adenylation domain-containing protein [Acidobacteriota bacterium]
MTGPSTRDLEDRLAGLSPAKRALVEKRLQARSHSSQRKASIPHRAGRKRAPLSFSQQRLWFLDRLEPGSASYNVPSAVSLEGPLDVNALQRSLDEIVRRHATLRTRFPELDGKPVQLIDEPSTFPMPVTDVGGLAGERRDAEVERLVREESLRPFDLARGPVFRAALIRLGPEEHVFLCTLHHIVSDGWSRTILFREIAALYEAFAAGSEISLPPLPIQYGDYAEWQQGWLRSAEMESQLEYWKDRLKGELPVLELPTDRPRPTVATLRGGNRAFAVPPFVAAALKDFCREEGVTLFMSALAVFSVLLQRYSGQSDLVVGSLIANRGLVETEGLIGIFINAVALRPDLSGDPTFGQLARRMKETALGAFAHQDLPFERLVEALHPDRNPGRSPVYQAMLNVDTGASHALRLPGLVSRDILVPNDTALVDITLVLRDRPEGLLGSLEYNGDLFDESTVDRMVESFQALLAGATVAPDTKVSRISILPEEEKRRILVEWNRTEQPYPRERCIHELFEARVRMNPRRIAIRDAGRAVEYEGLNRDANRFARYLRGHGVERGSVVGVCLDRSARTVSVLLGILKAGAAYVPLDPSYPAERITFMIRDSGASVVITEGLEPPVAPADAVREIRLDEVGGELAREQGDDLPPTATSDDLAYVIYTSGSTGTPKGVESVHRASVNRFAWMWHTYPFQEGEVCCQKTTLSFVDSVWETFGPLLAGVPSVVLSTEEARDPRVLVDRLSAEKVSRIVLVPSLLRALLDSGIRLSEGLPELRWWITSGEALPLDLLRRFRAAMPDAVLVNLYGSSEVSADVTFWDSREGDPRDSVPIGRPIANTRVYVVDANRQPVPVRVPGDLYVGGDGLARGYRNRPEMTAQRFVPDPFSGVSGARLFDTGDRARFLPDGRLEYLGRRDDQVKIRGFRVELGEVESALAGHPAVRLAAAALRGAPEESALVAYVVLRSPGAASAADLRSDLAARLPSFMIPSAFVFLPSMPLTPSGKLDRGALPAPGLARPDLEKPFVAPTTRTEKVLAGIWKELLRLDRVGTDDNFFSLGGHSLLLIQVSFRLRTSLGVDLPLRFFFELPTISALGRAIDDAGSGLRGLPEASSIRQAAPGSPPPVSFAQQRLWLIEQLDPGNTAYVIRRAHRLEGPLRPDALRHSVEAIVARHEVLRSAFVASEQGPRVEVFPPDRVAIPFDEVDLSHLSPQEREAEAARRAGAESGRRFDLANPPLLRAILLRLASDDHVFLVTVHHIVSDGWSLGVLYQEIAAHYAASLAGTIPDLPSLAIQYGDYASWQRESLQGENLERGLSYWRRELAGAPEVLDLETDRPRPPRRTARGERRALAYGSDLAERLKSLARREEATIFMTLAASYAALIAQCSSQPDIVIGSPLAGRNLPQTEPLVGLFVNTVVLRARTSGDPTFRELLGRVRETALGAYAHQDLPFEKLVEELRPVRNLAYNPIFQIWFVLQNAPVSEWDLPGIRASVFDPGGITVRHDIQLTMWEVEDGFKGSLDFSADLFDPATMDRIADEFGLVLRMVAADPQIPLSAIGKRLRDARRERALAQQRHLQEEQALSLKSARRKGIRG